MADGAKQNEVIASNWGTPYLRCQPAPTTETNPLINMSTNFHTDGYQIFRGCIPFHVTEMMLGHLERSFAKISSIDPASKIHAPTKVGLLPLRDRYNPALLEIAKIAAVQTILKGLLKANSLSMVFPPVARFIRPNDTSGMVPPHQDISYNLDLAHFVTIWIPLVEIDEQCGGVAVFEGSPSEVLPTQQIGGWNEALDTSRFTKKICSPMLPGDMLVFNKFMVHESMPNLSDRIRYSIDARFFNANTPYQKTHLNLDSWIFDNLDYRLPSGKWTRGRRSLSELSWS